MYFILFLKAVSSLASSSSDKISNFTMKSTGKRRQKLPFTEEEEDNLLHGVEKLGRFWTQILNTYSFHPSRTATDLKDKFRNMASSGFIGLCTCLLPNGERILYGSVRVSSPSWDLRIQPIYLLDVHLPIVHVVPTRAGKLKYSW